MWLLPFVWRSLPSWEENRFSKHGDGLCIGIRLLPLEEGCVRGVNKPGVRAHGQGLVGQGELHPTPRAGVRPVSFTLDAACAASPAQVNRRYIARVSHPPWVAPGTHTLVSDVWCDNAPLFEFLLYRKRGSSIPPGKTRHYLKSELFLYLRTNCLFAASKHRI